MKHLTLRDSWPVGTKIQIVKLGPLCTWNGCGNLAEKAKGLTGEIVGNGCLKLFEPLHYRIKKRPGPDTEHMNPGQTVYNLDDMYYIDLNDPDENY